MNVPVDRRWETFIERAVKSGSFDSASEVVSASLKLLEEREAKLDALRREIDQSLAEGGEIADEELGAALNRADAELARQGF